MMWIPAPSTRSASLCVPPNWTDVLPYADASNPSGGTPIIMDFWDMWLLPGNRMLDEPGDTELSLIVRVIGVSGRFRTTCTFSSSVYLTARSSSVSTFCESESRSIIVASDVDMAWVFSNASNTYGSSSHSQLIWTGIPSDDRPVNSSMEVPLSRRLNF